MYFQSPSNSDIKLEKRSDVNKEGRKRTSVSIVSSPTLTVYLTLTLSNTYCFSDDYCIPHTYTIYPQ